MSNISDRVNADPRLEDITMSDEEARAFPTSEASPVLATPAVVGGVALVTAGAAYGEAVD